MALRVVIARAVVALAVLVAGTASTSQAAPTVPVSSSGRITVHTLAPSGPGSLAAAIAGSGSGVRNETVTIDFADGISGTINLDETLNIGPGVRIEGPGRDRLTVRHSAPDQASASEVIHIAGGDVRISGMSIQAGIDGIRVTGNGTTVLDDIEVSGADATGVLTDMSPSSNVVIRSSTLRANRIGFDATEAGVVQIIDSEFIDNGTGFFQALGYLGTLVRGSTFRGNTSGMSFGLNGAVIVEETTFVDNTYGLRSEGGQSSFKDSTFIDNATALHVSEGEVLDVFGSRFVDNVVAVESETRASVHLTQSSIRGGATAIRHTGSASPGVMVIERSTVSEVSGPVVVAVYEPFADGPNAEISIVDSTIAGNHVPTGEALIQVDETDVEIIRSTVSSNSSMDSSSRVIGPPADSVGATPGELTLDHSIVSSNSPMSTGFESVGSIDARYSLVPVGSALAGSTIETDDAGLGPLADNGGRTFTMLPTPSSPAIDAGDPSGFTGIATDQRLFAREAGVIDIGATEAGGAEVGESVIGFLTSSTSIDDVLETVEVSVARTTPATEPASAVVSLHTRFSAPSETLTWEAGESNPQVVAFPISMLNSFRTHQLFLSISDIEGAQPGATSIVAEIDADWSRTVTPITPARLLDTRDEGETVDGESAGLGFRSPGSVTRFVVAGRGDVPPDAAAAMLNVTAVRPATTGYVILFPCSESPPNASSLNFPADSNVGNEVVAVLDASGAACVYTSAATHLTIDASAWVREGAGLEIIEPKRVFESRVGPGLATADGIRSGVGRLQAGTVTAVPISGRVGVPNGPGAALVNVTAIRPGARGFLSLVSCRFDASRPPSTASVNFEAAVNRGNEVLGRIDSEGSLCFYTSQDVDVTIDLVGFFTGPLNVSAPNSSERILDTRPVGETVDGQFTDIGPIAAGSTLRVPVDSRSYVAHRAAAGVFANVTALNAVSRGFLTTFPCDVPRPNTSSLNFEPGGVGGNEVVIELAPGGDLCIFASAEVDVTLDLTAELR